MGQIFFTKAEVKGLTSKQKDMLRAKAVQGVKEASAEIVAGVLSKSPKAKAAMRKKLDPMRSRMKSSKE